MIYESSFTILGAIQFCRQTRRVTNSADCTATVLPGRNENVIGSARCRRRQWCWVDCIAWL